MFKILSYQMFINLKGQYTGQELSMLIYCQRQKGMAEEFNNFRLGVQFCKHMITGRFQLSGYFFHYRIGNPKIWIFKPQLDNLDAYKNVGFTKMQQIFQNSFTNKQTISDQTEIIFSLLLEICCILLNLCFCIFKCSLSRKTIFKYKHVIIFESIHGMHFRFGKNPKICIFKPPCLVGDNTKADRLTDKTT